MPAFIQCILEACFSFFRNKFSQIALSVLPCLYSYTPVEDFHLVIDIFNPCHEGLIRAYR